MIKTLAYLLISASLLGTGWLLYADSSNEITLENAFVSGRILKVNSPAEGTVENIMVHRGQFVATGDLMFVIGNLETTAEHNKTLEELKIAVDEEIKSCIQFNAHELALKTELENEAYQRTRLERVSAMKLANALSEDELDRQRSELLMTSLRIQIAQQRLDTSAYKNLTPILERANVMFALTRARESFYRVKSSSIYAPSNGYVYEVIAYSGKYVSKGENLLVLVPNEDLFIEANVLESRLDQIGVNMPVRVIPDFGNGLSLAGRIHSIVPSVAASFSALPRNNVDSNWIKTSQRVPVVITLESKIPAAIPIGSSVKVMVDTSSTVAPPPDEKGSQEDDFQYKLLWEGEFEGLVDSIFDNRRAKIPAHALESCKWS